MNFKRIGRMVICMILVCCFLVNAFSIRAKATGVGTAALYALGAVAVEVVVAAAFQALGVMSGSDSSTFRSYVNDAVTWLTNSTTYVTNGMVQVLGFMSPDGVVKSFALKDMIQDLWQWMFDSGTVVSTTAFQTYVPVGTYYRDYQDNSNPVMVFRWCSLVDYNTTYYQYNLSEYAVCMEPDYRFVFGYQGSSTVLVGGKSYWYRSIIGNTVSSTSGYVQKTNVDNFFTTTAAGFEYIPNAPNLQSLLDIYGFSEIYADPGVTLGQIQSPYLTTDTDEETIQIEIAPIYVDWTTGQVSQRPSSNDDEKIWLPLGVPSTDLDEILTQNQDQAQSGDTSLEFDFETSTDPDTGGESGGNTGADVDTDYTTWFQKVVTTLENVWEAITNIPDAIFNGFNTMLGNVLEAIINIPDAIVNGIKTILQELFVPDPDFIPNKVAALQAQYTFLEPMQQTGEDLKLFFQNIGSQPPIIWIDLGAGTGWYPMGGKVKFIDLTWYSQYKPTVDPIIGGFIWLWAAWRLLHAAPGIISGAAGVVGSPIFRKEDED